jgi:hypothetical protein
VAELESFEGGITPKVLAIDAFIDTLRRRLEGIETLQSEPLRGIVGRLDRLENREEAVPFERLACFVRSLVGVALPHAIFNEWKSLLELLDE